MIKSMKKGFTLIELMIVVAIIGILAAIAIPNFIKFQARSKQSEVKANLKAIYTAQQAFLQEKDRFSASIQDIGFSPERGNRYAYALTAGGTLQTRNTETLGTGTAGVEVDTFRHTAETAQPGFGVTPAVETTTRPFTFLAAAAGNIDNDPAIDQWSVSSVTRASGASSATNCNSGPNPAGEPCNDNDDVQATEASESTGDDGGEGEDG